MMNINNGLLSLLLVAIVLSTGCDDDKRKRSTGRAPVIQEGSSVVVICDEDNSPAPFSLTLNASDADGDTLTWSILTPAVNGVASVSATTESGLISYLPVADWNGTDRFVVQVSDGELTDTLTVTVMVMPVNDQPVITEGSTATVTMSEDSTPTPFSLTLNATDADGDTLTWSILASASNGVASVSGTGVSSTVSYVPNADWNGLDRFVVQVSDGELVDLITVTVSVSPVNDRPVIVEGNTLSVTMDEDSLPTPFSLSLNATDGDGDPLVWSILTQASHGVAAVSGAGSSKAVAYSPAADWSGADSFVVQVSDGRLTDTITVHVTVTPVNDSPVIVEGNTLSFSMDEVASPTPPFSMSLNATDADGDTLTWSILTQASHGVASVAGTGAGKTISYIPVADWNGTDSFVVQVSDGELTDTVTISVTVLPVNDAPEITQGDTVAMTVDTYATSTPTTYTYLHATDIDGDTLTWSIFSGPAEGTAIAGGVGTTKVVGYTHPAGWSGSDSFVIQVSDGELTDRITVTVGKRQIQRRDPFLIRHAMKYPCRVAQGPLGKYYISDPKINSVFIFDTDMTLVAELSGQHNPLGVAVDAEGKIYVGNAGRKCIEVYGTDGVMVKTIGKGDLTMPNDIVLGADGRIYVVDSRANAVKVYAQTGELIRSIGDAEGNGVLSFPIAVAIKEPFASDTDVVSIEVFVADQRSKSIKVFDGNGLYLRKLNGVSGLFFSPLAPKDTPRIANMGMFGSNPFVRLQSLAFDSLDELHVLDSFTHKVTVLDPVNDGIKRTYGSFGKTPGLLNLPLDIVISQSGASAITSANNNRIDVIIQN